MADTNDKPPFRIEISIDRASARRALIVGGTLVLLAIGGMAVAGPVTFQQTEQLTAAKLNSLSVLTVGTKKYSVGATKYCGATTTGGTSNDGRWKGALGGYSGAKGLCEAACGSTTAHMCLPDELVRSRAVGIGAIPNGWYSAGVQAKDEWVSHDCVAWTSSDPTDSGAIWSNVRPQVDLCSVPAPVLCCD